MTIIFSEDEMEWINKKPFAWKIKKGCPQSLKTKLQKKLDLLYKEDENNE